jgi:hypothetical protein
VIDSVISLIADPCHYLNELKRSIHDGEIRKSKRKENDTWTALVCPMNPQDVEGT